ncbi:MAG: hypothetical protein LBC43_03225 [Bifidobacteriaceae bacterium]|nr:hypothetical protein [Bifidobacteriaceae bacterium]
MARKAGYVGWLFGAREPLAGGVGCMGREDGYIDLALQRGIVVGFGRDVF